MMMIDHSNNDDDDDDNDEDDDDYDDSSRWHQCYDISQTLPFAFASHFYSVCPLIDKHTHILTNLSSLCFKPLAPPPQWLTQMAISEA